MIIMKITGGLGNQMFQYACGRALAIRNNDTVSLDISAYSKINVRKYILNNFDIKADIATAEDIARIKYPCGWISKVGWFIKKVVNKIIRRFNIRFDQEIFNSTGDKYLDGYWQSEKYFLDCADSIRQDFSQKYKPGPTAEILYNTINSDEFSVSVHVRRGDNVSNPASIRHHGTPNDNYYVSAIEKIASIFKEKINLYIFSDDIQWVKQNLKTRFRTTFVSQPNIEDWEEILLMSTCRHHIISNSSFSWWGAWLNPKKNKIVITPKQWVRTSRFDYTDTIPASWLRI